MMMTLVFLVLVVTWDASRGVRVDGLTPPIGQCSGPLSLHPGVTTTPPTPGLDAREPMAKEGDHPRGQHHPPHLSRSAGAPDAGGTIARNWSIFSVSGIIARLWDGEGDAFGREQVPRKKLLIHFY